MHPPDGWLTELDGLADELADRDGEALDRDGLADELADADADGLAEVPPSDVVYVVGVYAPLQLPAQEAGKPNV